MGVPEKPEDYFKDIKLENGAVIGEADKPLVDAFAQRVHKVGATPAFVTEALNWYYDHLETQAAAMDEADDEFMRESTRALKEEFGAAYRNIPNKTALLFKTAPGGMDSDNPNSLMSRLLRGRTTDGRIIGNDPEITRWLVDLAKEAYPAATVVEDGNQSGVTIEQELDQIAALRKTDKRKYYSEAVQRREAELLAAREKVRARA